MTSSAAARQIMEQVWGLQDLAGALGHCQIYAWNRAPATRAAGGGGQQERTYRLPADDRTNGARPDVRLAAAPRTAARGAREQRGLVVRRYSGGRGGPMLPDSQAVNALEHTGAPPAGEQIGDPGPAMIIVAELRVPLSVPLSVPLQSLLSLFSSPPLVRYDKRHGVPEGRYTAARRSGRPINQAPPDTAGPTRR